MNEIDLSTREHAEAVRSAGRVLTVLAAAMCASALVVWFAPQMVARRMCVAVLPDPASWAYAQTLLRYLAVCAFLCGSVFLIVRAARGQAGAAWLHCWCVWSAVALYVACSASYWWYVDDDAAISFTYARNLADGHGLVYNRGDEPVEGYSNPLWVAILAAARAVGADIVLTAKVLGIVLGAVTVLLAGNLLAAASPHVWPIVLLVAGNASFIVWNNSGLESALHGLLLIGVVSLLGDIERLRGRRLVGAVALLSLLVLLRPEGALFALFAGLYLGLRGVRSGNSLTPALVVSLGPGLVLAGLIVFRYMYFHDVLPNTFYAKGTATNPFRILNPFSGGWRYVFSAAQAAGWSLCAIPLLVLCARRAPLKGTTVAAALIAAAHLFFVISVGGDWMAGHRFIAPIVPIVAVLVALGFARLCALLGPAWRTPTAGALLCLAPALFIVGAQVQRLIRFEHHPTTPMQIVARIGRQFLDLARQAGVENPTLLYHDAGGSAFVAGIHVIDLGGLCDRTVAHHWRDRETLRRYFFEEVRPTFICSSRTFAYKVGLESFPEFETDYVALPPPSDPALECDIRRARRDVYTRLFPDQPQ